MNAPGGRFETFAAPAVCHCRAYPTHRNSAK